MPWENGRKRRYSDVLEDPYRGPQEFMEAGARGFLITTIPDREEHAIDEAVKCLRKSCVKLFGGIRPLKREDASFAKGYVMVDFMDPETVKSLPHPDADKVAAEEKENTEIQVEAVKEVKETEAMDEEVKLEVEESKVEGEVKTEEETKDEQDTTKAREEKEKEEKTRKEELRKKRREEEEKAKPPLMLAPHKFNCYRTELRNIMFIKSDVVDPGAAVTTVFDLIMERKPLLTDCLNQLLPVQGVCDNDYKQLEIMCRRVLVPYVGEHIEAPSFGVMLVDKMCEPGAEVLLEVVRSAIWCLNPNAWQCSPWCEPDVVIHVEIIGSKIILSAMSDYMKYRQYSPFALHELGHGKPENERNLLREPKDSNEEGKERDNKARSRKKGKDKKRDDKDKKEDNEKKDVKEGKETKEGDKETKEEDKETKEEDKETKEEEKETKEEEKEIKEEEKEIKEGDEADTPSEEKENAEAEEKETSAEKKKKPKTRSGERKSKS